MEGLSSFLLLLTLTAVKPHLVALPDGRVFELPDDNPYLVGNEFSEAQERLFVLTRHLPQAHLLCPRGYFIVKINQELVINKTFLPKIPPDIAKQDGLSLLDLKSHDDSRDAPCPTAYHCLGYQACIFEYSDDLCQRYSSLAGFEEFLLLTITCYRNDLFRGDDELKFKRNIDKVLHFYYVPDSEDGSNLTHVETSESEVLDVRCLSPEQATNKGYFGRCNVSSAHMKSETPLWTFLAKTTTPQCRTRVQESYCALQLNAFGLCAPPNFRQSNVADDRNLDLRIELHFKETNYKEFLKKKKADMISVRLAFVLMVQKNFKRMVELFNTVYRSEFLYVFHVEKEEIASRKEIEMFLRNEIYPSPNVVLLPVERSHSTAFNSYEKVRAKLECFEELLRLGIWDFVVTLTEEHYFIRKVEDLALALAPHRDFVFLPDISAASGALSMGVSCDGRLHTFFSVNSNSTEENEFKVYKSSEDGLLNRDFVEYLVDEKRRSNKYEFYLQTTLSADEVYIPTILMNSAFRNKYKLLPFHARKQCLLFSESLSFAETKEGDVPGPAQFDDSHANSPCFIVQFPKELTSREAALQTIRDSYHSQLESVLPPVVLKIVVDAMVSNVAAQLSLPTDSVTVESINDLRILPDLSSHTELPGAQLAEINSMHTNYEYWIDILVFNKTSKQQEKLRILMEPSLSYAKCYTEGKIRYMSLFPLMSKSNLSNRLRVGVDQNWIFPYFPSNIEGLVILATTEIIEGPYNRRPYDNYFIEVNASLVSPEGIVKCTRISKIPLFETVSEMQLVEKKEKEESNSSSLMFIPCRDMDPGFWKLNVHQLNLKALDVITMPFFLLNVQDPISPEKNVERLWQLKSFGLASETEEYDFRSDETLQRVAISRHRQERTRKKKKPTFRTTEIIANKYLHSSHIEKKSRRRLLDFICGGGLSSSIAILLTIITLFSGGCLRVNLRLVLMFLFTLSLVTVLQVVLLVSLCN